MRDKAVRHEVVRAIDIEVMDGPIERHTLNALHDVEGARFVHHHHAGTNRGRGHERQEVSVLGRTWVRSKARDKPDRDVEHVLDVFHSLYEALEVAMAGFEAPPVGSLAGRSNRESRVPQGLPTFLVVAGERDSVQRTTCPRIAAKADRESPAQALASRSRLCREMRMVEAQAFVFQELAPRRVCVQLTADSIEERLVGHETSLRAPAARRPGNERQGRESVSQGKQGLRCPCLGFAFVHGHDPTGISVLAV
ncbi:MAG: hypothetical protein ACJ743_08905 [Gaiellaceae bacterium]